MLGLIAFLVGAILVAQTLGGIPLILYAGVGAIIFLVMLVHGADKALPKDKDGWPIFWRYLPGWAPHVFAILTCSIILLGIGSWIGVPGAGWLFQAYMGMWGSVFGFIGDLGMWFWIPFWCAVGVWIPMGIERARDIEIAERRAAEGIIEV